jgi:hypothetical protein
VTVERQEQALIDEYIKVDPRDRGPADAYLVEYSAPVSALIAYCLGDAQHDVDRVAVDYEVPVEAVPAALAYYQRHKAFIDAKLLLNAA